jgi:flagellar hook-associated protein 2
MATTTTSTTSTSSTAASTAAAVAAANKANAQKIKSSLNAGSGVDVTSLAQNLVDAEKMPQANALNAKIAKNEARISGYSAVSFVVNEVQSALTALKDQTSFSSVTAVSSNPSAFSVTAGATAVTGSHEIEVLQLAKAQRNVSNGVALPSTQLNGGKALTLNLTVGGVAKSPIALADGKDTPQDLVNAINAASTGVKAQLINTGDGSNAPYQIVLTGPTGSAGAFTMSTNYGDGTSNPGLAFSAGNGANQSATDAIIKVDGISVTRSTNSISDVVDGLTFDFKTTSSAAQVNLTRDTSALKAKFDALVTAYNDANTMFGVVTDPKSTVDTYGATLVGDSTVRSVRQQMRSIFQGTSSTPGTTIGAMWQMGVKVDEKGVMSIDATKLDAALQNNFSDVVTAFTGNHNGLSAYSTQNAGFAGDGVRKLSKLLSATGPMLSQSTNADTQNTKYKDDLTKLDTRMSALLSRYTKQFAAMDSLVGSVNSQKTSLKATFDGMMATYTNK